MGTDDVGWAHAQALADMLEPLPYTVFIGEVDDDSALEYPYLVLWPPPVARLTITLAGYGGEAITTTQITAAGRDIREVLAALDRTAGLLHRRRPHIPGRRCGLIRQQPEVPDAPQRDPQVTTTAGRPIYFGFLMFTFSSSPAAG